MLQKIRDKITGWFAGVVIALVGGAFIFWGIEFYFVGSSSNSDVVAVVNGVKITHNQVNGLFMQLQRQVAAQSANQFNDQMTQELKSYALQSNITNVALLTTLQKDGFRVSLAQVEAMIAQVPQFQVNGQFSQEKLAQILSAQGMSPIQFFQKAQAEWLINQAIHGIAATSFVLPNEINQSYELMHQKRAFGYFVIPVSHFLNTITISKNAISDYYDQNKTAFMTPEEVRVSYLKLSPSDIEKTIKVTAGEAKQYYEAHQINFKKQPFENAEKNIMNLLKHQRVAEILTHESSQLANLTYINPDSLKAASDSLKLSIQTSNWITRAGDKTGLMSNPKVLAAIFSDTVYQQNNNSNPIELQDGTQLVVRIDQKRLSQLIPLSQVKGKIEQILKQKQAIDQSGLLAYQIQTKLISGENPVNLAQKNKLNWKTVDLTAREAKNLSVSKEITDAAFLIPAQLNTKKPVGVNTIQLKNGDYAIVAVLQVEHANSSGISLKEKTQLQQKLSALWGQMLQHFYVDSIVSSSKIVMKN